MQSEFLQKLLDYYGLDERGYVRLTRLPLFSDIPSLDGHPQALKMKKRLEEARERGEKLIIYGDYDTDGIMSASICKKALKEFGIEAAHYIPSRYLDGYGINLENAKKIAKGGYSLVLCVDNGVAAFEALEYLKEQGIDVLIIDHHEIQGEIAPCHALIHPVSVSYGPYAVSAGYLSFLFSRILLGRDDPYLAMLGGLSTMSDMMPLLGYNRDLVRMALSYINETHCPQIFALLDKGKADYNDLKMTLIPAINAIGRMEEDSSINRLVGYFAEPFTDNSLAKANWMKRVNAFRKEETKKAEAAVEVDESSPSIVVLSDLKEGLNGLLANRLLNQYKKPIAIFSKKKGEEGVLVGSMRSLEGFDVTGFLNGNRDILLSGGGHQFAGGVSIKESDLSLFKKRLDFASLKHQINPPLERTIEIELSDINLDNVDIIDTFEPFGQEWKSPKLLLKNIQTTNLGFTRDGRFLNRYLPKGPRLFSFNLGERDFVSKSKVDLLGELRRGEYLGSVYAELLVSEAN